MAKGKFAVKMAGLLQILKDKSEKIALGICVAIMVLFGGMGLWGSITAPNPEDNSKEMKKMVDGKSQQFKNASPGDNDGPGPDKGPVNLAAIDRIDPNPYRPRQLFSDGELMEAKRRVPEILNIDEALVSVSRVAVKSYMFGKDYKTLTVLKGAASAGGPNLPGAGGPMPPPGKQGKMSFVGARRPVAGATQIQGYSAQQLVMLKQLEFTRKPLEQLTITKDEFEKSQGYRPAEMAIPTRMVIVNATFPYKAQLEEFRSKLRLNSFNEVLGDGTYSPIDKSQVVPAFRFIGLHIQRRVKKTDGAFDDWKDLDVRKNYLAYANATDFRFEEEDPNLAFFQFNGLSMPKLKAFDSTQYPALANTEYKLGKIKAQVDELERKNKESLAMAKPRGKGESFDVFSFGGGVTTGGLGTGGEGSPFGPMGVPGPGGGPLGAGGNRPMAFPSPMGPGGATGFNQQDADPPIHVLVRFIDVDVLPGQTYDYRVQVRMGNPNFQRKTEVASPTYADATELVSEWSKAPIRATVSNEFDYFVVDQRKVDDPKAKALMAEDVKRQLPMQVHKWVLNAGQQGQFLPVGNWGIAERIPVFRGENVGREQVAKVPLWIYFYEGFGLVTPRKVKGQKTGDGIPIDFGHHDKVNQEVLLVDFEGPDFSLERRKVSPEGRVSISRVEEKDALTEAYLLGPNGKLQVRSPLTDKDNKARVERLSNYRDRVNQAESFMKGEDAPGGNPNSPFNKGS
ncbi:MAG: hypothetical protein EXR99_07260 [Gemmataceae bacterium]|nr:hypothetical protein [Gemmataceae bacterium]